MSSDRGETIVSHIPALVRESVSEKVIPPWEPVRLRPDGRITLWNKSYRLNGLGLADEVVPALESEFFRRVREEVGQ